MSGGIYHIADPLCRFFCPNECGRSYKRKSGLTQHLNYECGIEPKFKCTMCGQKCAQKSTMKSHIRKVHKVTGLIKCQLLSSV